MKEVFIGEEGGGRLGGGRIDIHLIGLGLRELICVHRRVLEQVWGSRGMMWTWGTSPPGRGTGLQIVRHQASV